MLVEVSHAYFLVLSVCHISVTFQIERLTKDVLEKVGRLYERYTAVAAEVI